MRLRRSSTVSDTLGSAAAAVQSFGINVSDGGNVRGPNGTTVTMNGQVGTVRTATVTDAQSGRVIGTINVDQNCIVTGTTPAS